MFDFQLLHFWENLSKSDKVKIIGLAGLSVFAAAGFIVFKMLKGQIVLGCSPSSVAKKFIGKEETSANRAFVDKDFEAKMRAIGWTPGAMWCAFFAKMVWLECLSEEKKATAKKLLSGSSQQTYLSFKNSTNPFFEVSMSPKVDSIAVWYYTAKPENGHVGIVTEVGNDTFSTVEGNTNANGSQGIVKAYKYTLSNEKVNNTRKLRGFINIK